MLPYAALAHFRLTSCRHRVWGCVGGLGGGVGGEGGGEGGGGDGGGLGGLGGEGGSDGGAEGGRCPQSVQSVPGLQSGPGMQYQSSLLYHPCNEMVAYDQYLKVYVLPALAPVDWRS